MVVVGGGGGGGGVSNVARQLTHNEFFILSFFSSVTVRLHNNNCADIPQFQRELD